MCGEKGGFGRKEAGGEEGGCWLPMSMIYQAAPLLCEVAFDCELVTRSRYLLLLGGLTQSPPPPHKRGGGGVDGGVPITGQAALIVWLNSWLIEWEMELGMGWGGVAGLGPVPRGCARPSARKH